MRRLLPCLPVLLLATACSGGASRAPLASGTGPVAVEIRDYAFGPAAATVRAGTPVTWTEHDPDIEGAGAHSVVADDGAFASAPRLAAGAAFTWTPPAPGTYAYHCGIHNYMTGTLTVV
ncbi:MAG TPA: cupredoxin domain-containing protein [Mycobacteriales bacterium]|nr:cupredoxin domain-containing protein [Mycobacteriales bacterium]